jgi:hypothetical protein
MIYQDRMSMLVNFIFKLVYNFCYRFIMILLSCNRKSYNFCINYMETPWTLSIRKYIHDRLTLQKVIYAPIPLPRVEAGSNTSTVALRAVGGYEKGTQCLGVVIIHYKQPIVMIIN